MFVRVCACVCACVCLCVCVCPFSFGSSTQRPRHTRNHVHTYKLNDLLNATTPVQFLFFRLGDELIGQKSKQKTASKQRNASSTSAPPGDAGSVDPGQRGAMPSSPSSSSTPAGAETSHLALSPPPKGGKKDKKGRKAQLSDSTDSAGAMVHHEPLFVENLDSGKAAKGKRKRGSAEAKAAGGFCSVEGYVETVDRSHSADVSENGGDARKG